MAFPQVQDRLTSEEGLAVTTHNVDLPSTVNEGDLLLVFFARGRNAHSLISPRDWTIVGWTFNANDQLLVCYAKEADGTEGGGTLVIETIENSESTHVVYRITGYSSVADILGDGVFWYSDGFQNADYVADFNVCLGVCDREEETDSLDPSAFQASTSSSWTAATISVPPSGTEFPSVKDFAVSEEGTNVTSHTVSLPGSISSGDLLVTIFSMSRTNSPTISWPSGWTEFAYEGGPTSGSNTTAAAWRKADGSEGSSITVSTDDDGESGHKTFSITGAEDPTTEAPESSTASGSSTSPDPPSLTPSGGSDKYLWIAAAAHIDEMEAGPTGSSDSPDPPSLTPAGGTKDYLWIAAAGFTGSSSNEATAAPTDYSNLQTIGDFDTGIGTAERELNASSEDPGVFTWNESNPWTAMTVAVYPESGETVTENLSDAAEGADTVSENIITAVPSGNARIVFDF
jgi:hypothetical protein